MVLEGWKWGRGRRYGGYSVLDPLSVLGCSSVVVGESACVRDCEGLEVCKNGSVD
jgi:hypothetical protein